MANAKRERRRFYPLAAHDPEFWPSGGEIANLPNGLVDLGEVVFVPAVLLSFPLVEVDSWNSQ